MITRSVQQQSLLNAYWIPINFQNSAILTIAVPAALLRFAPANHTTVLATLARRRGSARDARAADRGRDLGSLPPQRRAAPPVHPRRVRASTSLGLLLLSESSTLEPFAVALLVAVLGQSISLAAYQPLIPEVVHRSEWGLASGYQGIASLIGSVLGLGLAAS